MKRRLAIYFLLALQLAGLSALYAWHAAGLSARPVMVRCLPVDPRDLLRGDYIILRYEISRLSAIESNAPDGPVFVSLREEGGFWVIAAVEKSAPSDDRVYLRAERRGQDLVYGLERFYVPEGKGNPPGPITVELAVRPDGRGQVKRVFSNGQPWPPPR